MRLACAGSVSGADDSAWSKRTPAAASRSRFGVAAAGVAVAAEPIGAGRVERDQQDVRLRAGAAGTGAARTTCHTRRRRRRAAPATASRRATIERRGSRAADGTRGVASRRSPDDAARARAIGTLHHEGAGGGKAVRGSGLGVVRQRARMDTGDRPEAPPHFIDARAVATEPEPDLELVRQRQLQRTRRMPVEPGQVVRAVESGSRRCSTGCWRRC